MPMSYQVLARKWRPRNFQEMVGQEPILRMLINALDHQRLHHAYLFTGTRGVGKTTLARILAKCLNCETGITSKPCGTCSICQSVDAGKFLDLLEIDAASRTKVEDTREILDNVQYAPTQGRFKIYLIDEVHMLSGHSFNALLKTLEEPPAHVKFLLATTDPKKLPITILSRCLQFNLKRVSPEQISQHLQHLCEAENIPYENPALAMLAKAADGSMRDALSLLDQTIAYCGNQITTQDTRIMLGNIEQDAIFRLLNALADQDGKQLLDEITALSENAPNFQHVLEELLSILHQINLAQLVPQIEQSIEQINLLAKRLSAEDVQLYYQIALIGRKDLAYSPDAQQGFEMTLLRMLAFTPAQLTVSVSSPTKPVIQKPNPAPAAKQSPPEKNTPEKINPIPPSSSATNDWPSILAKLELTGMAYALASNCILMHMDETKIELALTPQHQPMLNAKSHERIEQALQRHINGNLKLEIKLTTDNIQTPAKQKQQQQVEKHQAATIAIKNDSTVKQMLDMFDATLDESSIKSL
jgi:DNA polymerase-3 subunit gamma/tau